MDHQLFFPRCEPSPMENIPVFGACSNEADVQMANADYYANHSDQQHDLQLRHGAYESSEDYRSQAYGYYAPCGPPYYAETAGANQASVSSDLPMRIDINTTAFVHRSNSCQIYDPHQQLIVGPCGSIGLPLASENWSGHHQSSTRAPKGSFEILNQRVIHDRSDQVDWLPAAQTNDHMGNRFKPIGESMTKECDQSILLEAHSDLLTKKAKSQSKASKKESSDAEMIAPKFQCFLCAKQYCRRSTLKTHLRHHSGERPYFCTVCGKSFAQAANLTAHKRIHTGEKPFACPICCRPFSQSSSLVTHKRTHTGEKPYQCPRCDKAFTDSSTLTKHVRTHTGVKPYSCGICMLSFSQSGNLNRHMKTHSKQQTQDAYQERTTNDEIQYQAASYFEKTRA